MKIGRELDAKVATDVMQNTVVRQKNGSWVEGTERGTRPLPAYSKEITAAWEVAQRLGITMIPISDGSWFSLVGDKPGWNSPAELLQYLATADFVNAGAAV